MNHHHTSVAFKEWKVICDALRNGRQSLILRKGGIHEGRDGFAFAHDSFYLFPTHFHAQASHVREGNPEPIPEWRPGDPVKISHHAQVVLAVTLTDWEHVSALAPYHIYTEDTVRQRFDWEGKGMSAGSIHVALVEIRELPSPWQITYTASFGGCRSWIPIPAPPETSPEEMCLLSDRDKLRQIHNLLVPPHSHTSLM